MDIGLPVVIRAEKTSVGGHAGVILAHPAVGQLAADAGSNPSLTNSR